MHLAYTPEQERLRQQLREYFAGLMTPELRRGLAETGGDYGDGRGVPRRSSASSAATAGWPWAGRRSTAGADGSTLDQLIFTDEAAIAGVPVPFLTINTVGPTIMRFGTPSRRSATCPGSRPARSTSRSATPSPRRAPTWPHCAPGPFATGTATSSTARRCGPA